MISHKETLVRILEQLVGYWDLAEGFLVLVKQSDDEKFIEELYGFIKSQIKAIQDAQQKEQVKQQLQKVRNYQQRMQSEEKKEKEEAEDILDDLFLSDV
jgi:hypothetical protein